MKSLNNVKNLKELSQSEAINIKGGFSLDPIGVGIGIVAGLLYCYDFGYNYAKGRL